MRIYQGRTLVGESVSYDDFLTRLGAAVVTGQNAPFLLVRDDDERLLISVRDSRILLSHAYGERRVATSYASTYVEGAASFRGLSKEVAAANENFIDPEFAIQAVRAFFEWKRMSDYVDFRYGTPDADLLRYPEPMAASKLKPVERTSTERFVEIPEELRDDMKEVCEYLEWAENDPDENIDYDDAIQVGGLCGGRLDVSRGMYEFSYYGENDEVWTFRLLRSFLDDIADGRLLRIKADVSAPK